MPLCLQFGVGYVVLDYAALLLQRQIVLRNQPTGEGRVLFTADDFCNFLCHPLMLAAAKSNGAEKVGMQLHRTGKARDRLSPSSCRQIEGPRVMAFEGPLSHGS